MYAAITFMAQIFGWDLFYFIMKEHMSDPTDSRNHWERTNLTENAPVFETSMLLVIICKKILFLKKIVCRQFLFKS